MNSYKLCPVCEKKNPISSFRCSCNTDIVGVMPTITDSDESYEKPKNNESSLSTYKKCPVCEKKNPISSFRCSCNADLVGVMPSSIDFIENEENTDVYCCICSHCGQTFQEKLPECIYCGRIISGTDAAASKKKKYFIRFVFGDFEIQESFKIGREPSYSPIGNKISNLDKVSRKHAEIIYKEDVLTVADNNSSNGVKVNGSEIVPQEPVHIKSGDVLDFSSQLSGTIVEVDEQHGK